VLEDNQKDERWMTCKLCNGPIAYGEPVSQHEDGWIHRFKTWCDAYKESVHRGDDHICKEMGITLNDGNNKI
jgi:hypothetical protein